MSNGNRVSPLGVPGINGPESHIYKASDAFAMLAPHGEGQPVWSRIRFRVEAAKALIEQEGAIFLDLHRAHNGERPTVMLAVSDCNGKPILEENTIAIENGEQCPPLC